MDNQEIYDILKEIRDLIEPISAKYGQEFRKEKYVLLKSLITPQRKPIYALLFDPRNLSQEQIALEAKTSQPTVSRFINALLDNNLIVDHLDSKGETYYEDKYDLLKLLEDDDGK